MEPFKELHDTRSQSTARPITRISLSLIRQSYKQMRQYSLSPSCKTNFCLLSRQLSWYRDKLDGRRSIPGADMRLFSPQRPDRFWGPPSLLYNEYRGPLSPGVKRPGPEVDHSPQSSAESRIVELYLHSNIRLHDIMLNQSINQSITGFMSFHGNQKLT
jgi:hypothetical protein